MVTATKKLKKAGVTRCPIDISVQLLANKWTIPLLRELFVGPRRPSDLEKTLKGISAKTLSERLQDLVGAELVVRVSHAEVPPRVEYSLTPLGLSLKEPLQVLKSYGEMWIKETGFQPYANGEGDVCGQCLDTEPSADCPSVADLGPAIHT